jgi:hypothetical protein
MQKILKFLSSLWGSLAVVIALFPGAAALLGAPLSPANSVIKPLYTVLPTIVASFGLLLLLSYKDLFSNLARARRWALGAFCAALLFIFALIAIRVVWLDIKESREFLGEGSVATTIQRNNGLVSVEKRYPRKTELVNEAEQLVYGDPLDVVALFLATSAFVGFTVAFGALGLHA